jgi:hypothetical protein
MTTNNAWLADNIRLCPDSRMYLQLLSELDLCQHFFSYHCHPIHRCRGKHACTVRETCGNA